MEQEPGIRALAAGQPSLPWGPRRPGGGFGLRLPVARSQSPRPPGHPDHFQTRASLSEALPSEIFLFSERVHEGGAYIKKHGSRFLTQETQRSA